MQDCLKLKEQAVPENWLVNISITEKVCISKYLEIFLIAPQLGKVFIIGSHLGVLYSTFFLSGFSFTEIDASLESRGREGNNYFFVWKTNE